MMQYYLYFMDNLSDFRNHVIHARKQDVLNIQSIYFNYEFNGVNLINYRSCLINSRKSVKFNIEGLSSLKTLYFKSKATKLEFSIKNLPS